MIKRLILCDCSGTQTVDQKAFGSLENITCSKIHTGLCTSQADQAAKFLRQDDAIVACLQERELFEELAEDLSVDPPEFVDIRDRAGWSEQGSNSGPKMAALVSDLTLKRPAEKAVDVTSEGLCLILGNAETALSVAEELSRFLSVTVMLPCAEETIPFNREFDVTSGTLKSASGTLGNFSVTMDALRLLTPGGRGDLSFGPAKNGAMSECDIILDLTGGSPLFPAPEKRDGYLRADPKDPLAIAACVLEASHMVGTFEKPLYLQYDPTICAHSRAQQSGCRKCLDICPTSAISSAGDGVLVDPMICAGCGACAALCPSGALSYDAPPVSFLFRRIQNLARAFGDAGGRAPRLLVHDSEFGAQMISLAARYFRGLPAEVIPLEVDTISGFGHGEMLAALGVGFTDVHLLLSPKTEISVVEGERTLANAIAGKAQISLIDVSDPDQFCDALYDVIPTNPLADPILPLGGRRDVTRLSAKALRPGVDAPIALPQGAPYGSVHVDSSTCTLCLSCASLCPSGALGDNPDLPQLRFQEAACLQCGICETACPENAISLLPRLNLDDAALEQTILHQEEPFACIECGALFGVKSTIEHVITQLEGKHAMFSNSDNSKLIQMCDTCRVNAQYHSTDNPFQQGDRPKVRTTDDYLKARKDH